MSSDRPFMMSNERLQAAMACLDLSLEAELALYRRHHHQSLLALTESSRIDEVPEANPSEQLDPNSEPPVRYAPVDDLSMNDALLALHSESEVPSETFEDATRALIPFVQNSQGSAKAEDEVETLPKPYGAEITAEPKAFERFLDPSIEDYLESSEALLKHLEESATSTDRQVKQLTQKSWATTLRNIAIIIGVLGIFGILGMLIIQWFVLKPRKPAPVPQSSDSQSSSQPLPVLNGANQPLLTETVNAKPLTPSPSISNATSVTASTSVPKPSPLASPSPAVPRNAANYAVVADYTNTESLQIAKKLVPDAFIANVDGQQRIQLAWLDELPQAQKLVEDLKNEGFAASIVAQN